MDDLISRQEAIECLRNNLAYMRAFGCDRAITLIRELPTVQPERKWFPCSNPPKHHRDVLVRGIEAIGNVTVHKVMQWDVDRWRPMNYPPSIIWKEWSEI